MRFLIYAGNLLAVIPIISLIKVEQTTLAEEVALPTLKYEMNGTTDASTNQPASLPKKLGMATSSKKTFPMMIFLNLIYEPHL